MSRLLRPESLPPLGSLVFNMADLEREAAEMVSKAKARAAEIVGQAQQEAMRIASEARRAGLAAGKEEGFQQGREDGLRRGQEEGIRAAREATSSLEHTLLEITNNFASRREGLVKQAERDLLELSAAVAGRVVRKEIALDPAAVQRALIEAVGLACERSKVTVRVNPVDLDAAKAVCPELVRRFAEIKDFEVLGDSEVERGGCRVLTEAGEVDMQVETQLGRLTRLLAGEAEMGPQGTAGIGGGASR